MSSGYKKIGLITTTSLVVGNMIGAGIFILPASLSTYGSISLLGWILFKRRFWRFYWVLSSMGILDFYMD